MASVQYTGGMTARPYPTDLTDTDMSSMEVLHGSCSCINVRNGPVSIDISANGAIAVTGNGFMTLFSLLIERWRVSVLR